MLRKKENIAQKEYIAEKASEHLFDGATIFIDGSSTAGMIIKHLERFHDIKVITNSTTVVEEATKYIDYIWLTGGRYNRDDRTFVGPEAEKFVRALNIDLFFFSSQGITETGEINDSSETDNSLRRVVMERSRRKIFLCDSSKVGIHRMFLLCTRFDVDDIICEKPLPWENVKAGCV
jgi:DeoR/GlpR family transcriptional regulator of sugar metabolism